MNKAALADFGVNKSTRAVVTVVNATPSEIVVGDVTARVSRFAMLSSGQWSSTNSAGEQSGSITLRALAMHARQNEVIAALRTLRSKKSSGTSGFMPGP